MDDEFICVYAPETVSARTAVLAARAPVPTCPRLEWRGCFLVLDQPAPDTTIGPYALKTRDLCCRLLPQPPRFVVPLLYLSGQGCPLPHQPNRRMASLKLVLRADKVRRDGTAPIYLRITHNRRTRYVKSEVAVEPRHWNADREEVRKTHPKCGPLNDALEHLKASATLANLDLVKKNNGAASAVALKRVLKGKGTTALLPYAEDFAAEWLAKGKYWEFRKVNVLIRKLREFSGSKDLAFSDIDRDFLNRFSAYMATKLGNKRSTQQKNLQILRGIVKRAVVDGLIGPTDDSFLYYSIGSTPGQRERLRYEDILALAKLDLPRGSELDLTRDTFLFAFYASGMRFGDLCALRWRNVVAGRLNYTMMKSGKVKSVKLASAAEGILAKYHIPNSPLDGYIFPLLEQNRDLSDPVTIRKRISVKNGIVNRRLKDLAKMIETPINLTFHVSRHTFADHARRVSGNIDAVSKALGHSKLSTTQTYISGTDVEAEDALLDLVFPQPAQPT